MKDDADDVVGLEVGNHNDIFEGPTLAGLDLPTQP